MTDYSRDIEKYIKGELSPAERNALERKALHDPFLADALEGAEQIKSTEFLSDVAELNKKLANRKAASSWIWPARIAAGIALVVASAFIVWTVLEPEPIQDLALEKSIPPTTLPQTTDSISASGELSSSPTETSSSTSGPTRDKDVARRSEPAPKKLPKPQEQPSAAPVTPEIKSDVAVAETKPEEIKVTEPITQAKEKEEVGRAKAGDDQEERKLDKNNAKKKSAPAYASESAPKDLAAGFVSDQKIITGKVTSVEDGSPLPGVNVMIKGSTIGTSTDAEGNYQIVTEAANPTLVYSFIGLNSTEVKIEDQKEANVQLSLDTSELSEVVVTGYGVESGNNITPTVDMPHPTTGNRSFKQYLEKNMRYPEQAKANKVEGRVTVEFTIESDGTLSNFTIVRGIGSGCDEELIRLIKEGPKWVPMKYDKIPVQGKAKVRLKFELPK